MKGDTIFLVECVNIYGYRPSKEERGIISLAKAGEKWTRNMSGWAEENTVDKDVNKIDAKQAKYDRNCVDRIGGSKPTDVAASIQNPLKTEGNSVHCNIQDK